MKRGRLIIKSINGIKKGDIVKTNRNYCYYSYSQFIIWHPQYAIRWAYKCYPNEEHKFVVKGIYKHVQHDKYDYDRCCVVIQDCITRQIFLMGEHGLRKTTS